VVGGAEVQQSILARLFVAHGYRVTMVCQDFGQPDGAQLDGVVVRKVFAGHEGIPVLRFVHPRLTRMWRVLREVDADIYYYRSASMWVGILAVPKGQTEAALALSLTRVQRLRLVVLPQALRVMIPPLTSQYLNLTKNSSLAVAIGYPDVVSIANTALNQTGRALECISLIMAVYLCTSLLTAALMGVLDRRAAIRER
jgi:hypothetical protein